ncbi:hypothetical protein EW145_g2573 [Phellinidium pouzarii]|uniref:Major facilitator superfamily (MFS) profile domain-containing protein n=1 Tax=Phellinidium pouzarii TaxID=167371 RepID=A0A4S4LAL6_9AGAM|nr:hypothetical protein EW145_g2573 [Phellinidium pouzarii]
MLTYGNLLQFRENTKTLVGVLQRVSQYWDTSIKSRPESLCFVTVFPSAPVMSTPSASGSNSVALSRAETLVGPDILDALPQLLDGNKDPVSPRPPALRKYALLAVFCLAQFLDVVNNASVMAAIPTIAAQLHMSSSEQVWIVSATQLAFASFLLLSGRISDVYSAKWAFVVGISILGIISVLMGLMHNKIALFILRAISGAFASLTIPSALNLIVRVFPDPLEQSRAVATFGGSGSIGNILGLFIGAIIVQYASWPWIFWFTALLATPAAIVAVFIIPGDNDKDFPLKPKASNMKGLDLIGVSLLTVSLILFIYSITTGSSGKWATAGVLVPLILAVILFVGFFYYETKIPEESAALPPRTWFYPNFAVLLGVSLLPNFWWTTLFLNFTTYWQDVFGWSAIFAVEHQLPLSIAALAMAFTGPLSRIIIPKWFIFGGLCLSIISTTLLAFASTPETYWPFVFPAFVIGSAGMQLTYTHANIAMFRSTPSRMAGTVGAIFNSALQLGSAVGSPAVTSISSSIENKEGPNGATQYTGRATSFWFLLGVVVLEALLVLVFYKPRRAEIEEDDEIVNNLPELNNQEQAAPQSPVPRMRAIDALLFARTGSSVTTSSFQAVTTRVRKTNGTKTPLRNMQVKEMANETNEGGDYANLATRKRALKSTRRKKEIKSEANPILYHGERARYHYFQCLQIILRMQISKLTELWKLPPEFESICKDTWALHLSLLPSPPPAEPYLHSQEQGEEKEEEPEKEQSEGSYEKNEDEERSDPSSSESSSLDSGEGESEVDQEMAELLRQVSEAESSESEGQERTQSNQKEGVSHKPKVKWRREVSPAATIAILIHSCWFMRIPVIYKDFVQLIETYTLPYLDPIRLLPLSLSRHLTKHMKQALSPHHAPTPILLHTITSTLSRVCFNHYGIFTPELNAAPILWRAVHHMGGNPSLYTLTKTLARYLELPLTLNPAMVPPMLKKFNKDPTSHKSDNVPPEVALIATIIIALKLGYGLDGKAVRPRAGWDPACTMPSLEAYLEQLKAMNTSDMMARSSFPGQSAPALQDDGGMLDAYLEFYERALLERKEAVRESADGGLVMEHFPLQEDTHTHAAERHVRFDADGGPRSVLPAVSIAGDESKSNALRPGESYVIYSAQDTLGTLPGKYATVLSRAALWACVCEDDLAAVVERFERRVLRLWKRSKRERRGCEESEDKAGTGTEPE